MGTVLAFDRTPCFSITMAVVNTIILACCNTTANGIERICLEAAGKGVSQPAQAYTGKGGRLC